MKNNYKIKSDNKKENSNINNMDNYDKINKEKNKEIMDKMKDLKAKLQKDIEKIIKFQNEEKNRKDLEENNPIIIEDKDKKELENTKNYLKVPEENENNIKNETNDKLNT